MKKYVDELPKTEAAKITATLADIETKGLEGAAAHVRPIEGKLWELKIGADRVFYVLARGPELVLLHAYRKQTQKAPRREVETAQRRMKEVLAKE